MSKIDFEFARQQIEENHRIHRERGRLWREDLASQGISLAQYPDNFYRNQATASRMDGIKNFVANPVGTLTMAGPCGNGKTLTAIAIFALFSLHYGPGARFVNAETLYQAWRDESLKGHVSYLVEKLSNAPLLVIDDLGQGDITDNYKRFIYSIINKRWASSLPIVITTNLVGKEFRAMFGDAVLSRISDGQVWKFSDKDHRIPENRE